MKIGILIFALTSIGLWSVRGETISDTPASGHEVKWVKKVEGNFSFTKKWSYPEGVYVNRHGQLSCDGLCPPEIDKMKDDQGRLIEDSLEAFYNIIDTTHLHHNFQSQAQTYEWGGTDYITFKQMGNKIIGRSWGTVGTHSGLVIEIQGNSYTAWIDFNSVMNIPRQRFELKSGELILDEKKLKRGIIKGNFDFQFFNTLDENFPLFWKGQICAKIE